MDIRALLARGWSFATERKEIRYIQSGVAGEVVDYVSFILLFNATGWLYFSNSASYIISAVVGFLFHKYWSFKGNQRHKGHQQFAMYSLTSGINFVLTNIIVGLFVHRLHVRPSYAKLLAIGITAVLSFTVMNFLTFRHKKLTPATENIR